MNNKYKKTYVVRPGDTLTSIAKAHHVSVDELIKANPQIKNPDLIYPGQIIIIPTSGKHDDRCCHHHMPRCGCNNPIDFRNPPNIIPSPCSPRRNSNHNCEDYYMPMYPCCNHRQPNYYNNSNDCRNNMQWCDFINYNNEN